MRLLRLKVHPAAREDRVAPLGPDRFEVWTRAEAERGQANAAVLLLMAAHLGLPPRRLRLVRGATSPSKTVAILG